VPILKARTVSTFMDLQAARNSQGWLVMTILETNFVQVNKQPYVLVFGTPIATNATRLNLDDQVGAQTRDTERFGSAVEDWERW